MSYNYATEISQGLDSTFNYSSSPKLVCLNVRNKRPHPLDYEHYPLSRKWPQSHGSSTMHGILQLQIKKSHQTSGLEECDPFDHGARKAGLSSLITLSLLRFLHKNTEWCNERQQRGRSVSRSALLLRVPRGIQRLVQTDRKTLE